MTGKKLTEAERVKAAGLAAAGFIPVVGWGGRAARGVYKGGKAIEGMVTADRALDAYKTTAGMQKLAQAEKGIYGLTVANSGYEFTSGRDMFGNKLTEEQRKNAMWESFGLVGSPFLARGVAKLTSKLPHNPAFVQNQINKAKQAVPSPANWASQTHRNTVAKPEVKTPVVDNIGKRTAPNTSSVQKVDVRPPSASIKRGSADSGAAPVNKVESKSQTGPGLGKKVDPVKEQEVRSQPKVVNGGGIPPVNPVKPEVKEVPKKNGNGKIVGEDVVAVGSTGDKKIDSDTIKKYIRDIEGRTGRELPKNQIEKLKEALRNKEYKKMSPIETAKHRAEFDKVRNNVIKEWEENTEQKWPVYNENVISEKTGKIIRKQGDKYDAHHIIENTFGGEHEWWNMHPAKFPNEHQAGIHGTGSPANTLLKGR
ncbi:hypothetical protein GKZ89_09740 [Bacillus mangrovi]|uniref:Uncharacterized protein n=1 Tax=Metabacillus mangrovi TaxID=1491830 RepID=A0A7X2V516_9BACI|nr:hypothetical protein [Metabacillus mangrovi]